MFSRDGAVAPLSEYLRVLPPEAWLLIDDAHGAGIIGQNGRGTVEYCGTNRRRLIQTITLSKAFGSYGGAILCSKQLREKIEERSQLFVGSTPLPLPLANAALQALTILETNPAHLSRLSRNSDRVKRALKSGGFALPPNPGPILALQPASPSAEAQGKRALLKAGIYTACIHYPGGPASGYFRFVISSEHSSEQLQNLSKTLLQNAKLFEPLHGPDATLAQERSNNCHDPEGEQDTAGQIVDEPDGG
jgi:7-keto-8-aminopelargonate synthetase-like enzyme